MSLLDQAQSVSMNGDGIKNNQGASSSPSSFLKHRPIQIQQQTSLRSLSNSVTSVLHGVHAAEFTTKVPSCTLQWVDLNAFSLKNNSCSLKNRDVLTIAGPSGSGKTVLLDLLANRMKNRENKKKILFNGRVCNGFERRKLVSYVGTDDSFLGDFTVTETIHFVARFIYGYSNDATAFIRERIPQVLAQMGLEECKDVMVGSLFKKGISGGQKKRLAIAVELIRASPIILIDEPTSGLDATAALMVMQQILKLSSELGHLIVLSIHQPSSEIFSRLKKLMLLADGKTIFNGEAKDVIDYFSAFSLVCPVTFNPSDFALILCQTEKFDGLYTSEELHQVQRNTTSMLIQKYAESEIMKRSIEKKPPPRVLSVTIPEDVNFRETEEEEDEEETWLGINNAGRFSTFRTLLHRTFLNSYRNPGMYLARLVIMIQFGILAGLVYLNSCVATTTQAIIARISAIGLVPTFMSILAASAIPFVMEDRAVFLRERRNGWYFTLSYAVAYYITTGFATCCFAIIPAITCIFMPPLSGNFLVFFLYCWMLLWNNELLAYCCAAGSGHYVIAISVTVSLQGAFMMLGGFFIWIYKIPWYLRWISYSTPARYSFRIAMRNEFQDAGNFTSPLYTSGQVVLDLYGFTDVYYWNLIKSVWVDLFVMFAFTLSYLLVFFTILKFRFR